MNLSAASKLVRPKRQRSTPSSPPPVSVAIWAGLRPQSAAAAMLQRLDFFDGAVRLSYVKFPVLTAALKWERQRLRSLRGNKYGSSATVCPEPDRRRIWVSDPAFTLRHHFWRNSVMNPNKALWEKGDFTRLAVSMRKSGESLVEGLGITKGLKVLDLDSPPELKGGS